MVWAVNRLKRTNKQNNNNNNGMPFEANIGYINMPQFIDMN